MADLVTTPELRSYLRVGAAEKATLEMLADAVEGVFEAQCGRADLPFQAPETARSETRDGTGTKRLHLDYPIAALTSVKLGADVADPDDTLDTADLTVIRFRVGSRRLDRVDGAVFRKRGEPLVVHVTYDSAADLPEEPRLQVLRMTAKLWRQRGSEGAKQRKILDSSVVLAAVMDDAEWKAAVQNQRRYRTLGTR